MEVIVEKYLTFKEKIRLTQKFERNYKVENLGNGILMFSKSVELNYREMLILKEDKIIRLLEENIMLLKDKETIGCTGIRTRLTRVPINYRGKYFER